MKKETNKKQSKNKKLFHSKYFKIISLLIIFLILVAIYNTFKPLPQGISYEGNVYNVSESDISFLYDLTYRNSSGDKIVNQTIFNSIFQSIDNAQKFIVIDMFLFNRDYSTKPEGVPLTSIMRDKLIEKKKSNPSIEIVFITDEMNNFYGSYISSDLKMLNDSGIEVVITDLTKLRDSNPIYSSAWRTFIQWFGTSGDGWITHPLGNQEHNVTLRSFIKLINTKANHRKVFVADSNDSFVSFILSANPHEASSLHSNIGFKIRGDIWKDVLETERAVTLFSEGKFISSDLFNSLNTSIKNLQGAAQVQILTEGKIKKNILKDIDETVSGESIDLAMFYISDRDIVKAIQEASVRGVNVRLLLDPNKDAFAREKNGIPNRQVAYELVSEYNVSIRWYDTKGEQFHTKLLIITKSDRVIVYGGSSNYTKRNLGDLNLESVVKLNIEPSGALAKEITSYYNRIWFNRDGNFTLDFEAYKDDSIFKTILYRFQEMSGFSSF